MTEKHRSNSWSRKEINYVQKNFHRISIAKMADHLGRTHATVKQRMVIMRRDGLLSDKPTFGGLWSHEEDKKLTELYPITDNAALPSHFPHRSKSACACRAAALGLKKDPEFAKAAWKVIASMGGKAKQMYAKAGGAPARFYGDKVGNARVYLSDHRPRHLDKRVDKFTSPKVYVSGSTLQGF